MNRKRISILLSGVCLSLALIAALFLGACAQPAPTPTPTPTSEAVEINWVSFGPQAMGTIKDVMKGFIDPLAETSEGVLTLNYRGGPETIPSLDQGLAVQSGTVDMSIVPVSYYETLAPGIWGAYLTQLTPAEERQNGAFEYLQEQHNKAGLYYVGRAVPAPSHNFFYLFTNKKVETQEDFVGMQIGSAGAALHIPEAWGATTVTVAQSDYYTAMERGLVDGINSAGVSVWIATGAYEATKYVVDHPYFQSTTLIIMNLDKWNSLSPEAQGMITDAAISSENMQDEFYGVTLQAVTEKMEAAGVEFYKFEDDDFADWFLQTAYDAEWGFQEEKYPDVAPKLKQLLSK